MLRTILVDDEALALKTLHNDLKKYCDKEVVVIDICDSPLQALKSIKEHRPDLVFLDIKMEGYEMDGFGILDFLDSFNFSLIFVTAYPEFALKALKLQTITFDYLLKPIPPEELKQAIHKVIRHRQPPSKEKVQELINELTKSNQKIPDQIGFPVINGQIYFQQHEIMYCKAEGPNTRIYLAGDQPFLSTKSLKWVSGKLSSAFFFRVHHSFAVNRLFVKKCLNGEGNLQVIMKNKQAFPVSRYRKKEFLRWMNST